MEQVLAARHLACLKYAAKHIRIKRVSYTRHQVEVDDT